MEVITHNYQEGREKKTISLCKIHSDKFNPPVYLGVKHGLHEGQCDQCTPITRPNEVTYKERIRAAGGSLQVTVPAQARDYAGIQAGDQVGVTLRIEERTKCPEEIGYNGWANWETWSVQLNISNDQGWYNALIELVQPLLTEGKKDNEIAQAIKDYLEEIIYNEEFNVYKIYDTWDSNSWHEVDWIEIANAWIDTVKDQ